MLSSPDFFSKNSLCFPSIDVYMFITFKKTISQRDKNFILKQKVAAEANLPIGRSQHTVIIENKDTVMRISSTLTSISYKHKKLSPLFISQTGKKFCLARTKPLNAVKLPPQCHIDQLY